MTKSLTVNVRQLAFVPAQALGEPFLCRWYVFVNGERRYRLLRTENSGCWYATAEGKITRLGSRFAAEAWVFDSLLAEHLRSGRALH